MTKAILILFTILLGVFIGIQLDKSENSISKKEHLGGFYYADNKQVYVKREHDDFAPFAVDRESFEVLNKSYYAKDKNGVYYHEFAIDQPTVYFDSEVKDAKREDFKALNNNYATDKAHIFYKREIVEKADVESFEVLGDYYAKDKTSVYYDGKTLKGANPKTFKPYYEKKLFAMAKDDKSAYIGRLKIKNIDINTFVPLGTIYFKDDKNIYCIEGSENLLTDFDYETFTVLKSGLHAKDKNGVYSIYSGECQKREKLLLSNIDPKTVEEVYVNLTTYSIFKDKNHVYNDNEIIEGADPKTFVKIDDEYFRDKDYIYSSEKRLIGIDPKKFDAKRFNYAQWADKYDRLD